MFRRLRGDDKKFAARIVGVKPSKIIAALQTEDGQGLAVYYYPPVKVRGTVWLLRIGYDRALHGSPVVFPPGEDFMGHLADNRWREV